MFSVFKSTSKVISEIEEFLTLVDESGLVFVEGIRHYLKGNSEEFLHAMEKTDEMEGRADDLRRSVEDRLYRRSLMPEFRSDVLHLLEHLDDLLDLTKENLEQFDIETPQIPKEVHDDFIELARTSVKAVESIVLSVRTFFRDPRSVKDLLHRVYFYESAADRIANTLKRKIYKETPELDLVHKNHVRHFIEKTESLSDVSEAIADLVAILAIKRTN